MTTVKSLKQMANDNYTRLGRHNLRILNLVRGQIAQGQDLNVVMDTLDRYYEVANPLIYEALQKHKDLRKDNAECVLEHGINLHHTYTTAVALDMDLVLARVCELTSKGGA